MTVELQYPKTRHVMGRLYPHPPDDHGLSPPYGMTTTRNGASATSFRSLWMAARQVPTSKANTRKSRTSNDGFLPRIFPIRNENLIPPSRLLGPAPQERLLRVQRQNHAQRSLRLRQRKVSHHPRLRLPVLLSMEKTQRMKVSMSPICEDPNGQHARRGTTETF